MKPRLVSNMTTLVSFTFFFKWNIFLLLAKCFFLFIFFKKKITLIYVVSKVGWEAALKAEKMQELKDAGIDVAIAAKPTVVNNYYGNKKGEEGTAKEKGRTTKEPGKKK